MTKSVLFEVYDTVPQDEMYMKLDYMINVIYGTCRNDRERAHALTLLRRIECNRSENKHLRSAIKDMYLKIKLRNKVACSDEKISFSDASELQRLNMLDKYDAQDKPAIIARATDPNAHVSVRHKAVLMLSPVTEFNELVSIVRGDESSIVRVAALRMFKQKKFHNLIVDFFWEERDPYVRCMIIGLYFNTQKDNDLLLKIFHEEKDNNVRAEAVTNLKFKQNIRLLKKVASDTGEDLLVRIGAISASGYFLHPGSLYVRRINRLMLRLIGDPDEKIRFSALCELADANKWSLTKRYQDVFTIVSMTDIKWYVRTLAIENISIRTAVVNAVKSLFGITAPTLSQTLRDLNMVSYRDVVCSIGVDDADWVVRAAAVGKLRHGVNQDYFFAIMANEREVWPVKLVALRNIVVNDENKKFIERLRDKSVGNEWIVQEVAKYKLSNVE
jgi:HEAT repeat protein